MSKLFNQTSKGNIHDKPYIMEASNNEGNGFIEMVFIGIDDNNVIVSEQRWVQLIEFLFQGIFYFQNIFCDKWINSEDSGSVLAHYDCPCSNAMDPACDCFDTADAFLTDYTWYCNQRYALTEGFSAADSRTYPIYSTLLRQPRPRNNDDIAFHGIGGVRSSWR